MFETPTHPTPHWQIALREQFHAVGLAVRREALVLGGLVVAFTGLAIWSYLRALGNPNHNVSFDFVPFVALPLIFLGFLVPLSVWKGDEPFRRSYLWSMPTDRSRHTLLKSVNGWVWFMALIAAYLLWMLGLAAVTGSDIGVESSTVFVGNWDAPGEPSPEDFRRLRWVIPAWQWAVPFTAATIAYLLGSVVAIASDHPWRWFGGILIGMLLLTGVADAAELPWLERATHGIFEGPYGLGTTFSGTREVAESYTNAAGQTVQRGMMRPVFGLWFGSTLLWLALGTAGVLAAAFRHQER